MRIVKLDEKSMENILADMLKRDPNNYDSYTETVLRERDLISVPAGIYRGLFNHGEEEALMCVMLGTPKPHIPTYPEDHPLSKVKRS